MKMLTDQELADRDRNTAMLVMGAVASKLEDEIAHCELNEMRLVPDIGRTKGALAVPSAYIKAALDGARRELGLPVGPDHDSGGPVLPSPN